MVNTPRAKRRERQCLVTREKYPTDQMIRFVIGPDQTLVPDIAGKLPGRGCWVLAEKNIVETAVSRNLFIRFGHLVLNKKRQAGKEADIEGDEVEASEDAQKDGKKTKITVPSDLVEMVERLLLNRCLDYLGLAKRSGQVISGFEKTKSVLKSGKSKVMLMAVDGADHGRAKVSQGIENLRIIDIFSRNELSQALGLENAVHVALLPDGITTKLLQEIARLDTFRNPQISVE